jgi:hypothetical protein
MTDKAISPLRRRLIEDMTIRRQNGQVIGAGKPAKTCHRRGRRKGESEAGRPRRADRRLGTATRDRHVRANPAHAHLHPEGRAASLSSREGQQAAADCRSAATPLPSSLSVITPQRRPVPADYLLLFDQPCRRIQRPDFPPISASKGLLPPVAETLEIPTSAGRGRSVARPIRSRCRARS